MIQKPKQLFASFFFLGWPPAYGRLPIYREETVYVMVLGTIYFNRYSVELRFSLGSQRAYTKLFVYFYEV